MNDIASKIAAQLAQATAHRVGVASRAAEIALDVNVGSKAWGAYASSLADAEGKEQVWARLEQAASYHGDAFTQPMIAPLLVNLLSAGADDCWSGRSNDLARARYDGVRAACAEAGWIG